jgi:hypothetical protein
VVLDPIDLPLINFNLKYSNLSDEEVCEELDEIQAQQNRQDISQDWADLKQILHDALEAESDAEMVQLLQLLKVDMEAIKMLLQVLEQTHCSTTLPDNPSNISTPQKRASTWPLDNVEAKEIGLLHRVFIERGITVLKCEWKGPLSHLPSWTITK